MLVGSRLSTGRLLFSLLFGAICCLAYLVSPSVLYAEVTAIPICTAPGHQAQPDVWGDVAVWVDARNDVDGPEWVDWDIYQYNMTSGIESLVSTSSIDSFGPKISEQWIAWGDMGAFWYRSRLSGAEQYYTNELYTGPAYWRFGLDDSLIAYSDGQTGFQDVRVVELNTATESVVCTAPGEQRVGRIDYPWITWTDFRTGEGDIYAFNMVSGEETAVCGSAGLQWDDDISGNLVVWSDTSPGISQANIMAKNLVTGAATTICSAAGAQCLPVIEGDWVFWQDDRNGTQDVYGYHVPTGVEYAVATGPGDQTTPAVSADWVVWVDSAGVDGDIYGAQLANIYSASDVIAPVTSISGVDSLEWVPADVNVTLTATDAGSGVSSTYYTLNGDIPQLYVAPFVIQDEGATTIAYWSVDASGNVEPEQSATVLLDKSAPWTTSGVQSDYAESAEIYLNPIDDLSGAAQTTFRLDGGDWQYGTVVATSALGGHFIEFYSTDNVGNVESAQTAHFHVSLPATDTIIPAFSANYPDSDGDWLIWTQSPGQQVRVHQISTGADEVLMTGGMNTPSISEGVAVFPTSDGRIRVVNLSTVETQTVGMGMHPDVSWPWVSWIENGVGVRLYNLLTSEARLVPDTRAGYSSISGPWVVWEHYTDPGCEVKYYNIVTLETTAVAQGSAPTVDGDWAVWRSGAASIQAKNLVTGETHQVQVPPTVSQVQWPVISGNRVVYWEGDDLGGDPGVYVYDMGMQSITTVSNEGMWATIEGYQVVFTTSEGVHVSMLPGGTPINHAPAASDLATQTAEDNALVVDVLSSASDVDGDPLTLATVTQPANGSVSILGNAVLYTADADFSGTDTFTYTAADGSLNSNAALVTVEVLPVNDAPAASDLATQTAEDNTLVVDVLSSASDVDGDPLTLAAVTQPANGSVSILGNAALYTPDADFFGTDSFTYTASDGSLNSNVALVTILVTPANDAPVASDIYTQTAENTALSIGVLSSASDIDADSLVLAAVTQPANGSVSILGNAALYTPDPNFSGTDTFTYTASDGLLNSNAAVVTVEVTSVDDLPPVTTAIPSRPFATWGSGDVTVTLTAVDFDGGEVAATRYALNSGASESYTGPFAVTAEGATIVTYRSEDTVGNLETTRVAEVWIDRSAPDISGLTVSQTTTGVCELLWPAVVDAYSGLRGYAVYRDGSLIATTTATALSDSQLLPSTSYTYEVHAFDRLGNEGICTQPVRYTTPGPQESTDAPLVEPGNDVTIELPGGGIVIFDSVESTGSLVVAPIDAREDEPGGFWLVRGEYFDIHPNFDYTGGAYITMPYDETEIVGQEKNLKFFHWIGTGWRDITVSVDTDANTITGYVTSFSDFMLSMPVNVAPLALADSGSTAEDVMLTVAAPGVLENDTDENTDVLTAVKVSDPAHGTVTLSADGGYVYTPEAGFAGTDTFTYKANDTVADSVAASVTVTVEAGSVSFQEIAGPDRYATGVQVSQSIFAPGSVDTVVIASGANWPDALGGGALAGAVGGPVLLVKPGELPDVVATEITRLGATKAIIVGGPAAVSDVAMAAIGGLAGVSAERIGGSSRYDTARLIAQRTKTELGAAYDGTVFLSTGLTYPDALAASPLAASSGWPILLTRPNELPDETRAALAALDPNKVLIVGGTCAVSDAVEFSVEGLVGSSATRLSGASRFDTAARIAAFGVSDAGLSWNGLALSTGRKFPDALTGGCAQAVRNSVIMLTEADTLPAETAAALSTNKSAIQEVWFLGGTAAISDEVRAQVAGLLE